MVCRASRETQDGPSGSSEARNLPHYQVFSSEARNLPHSPAVVQSVFRPLKGGWEGKLRPEEGCSRRMPPLHRRRRHPPRVKGPGEARNLVRPRGTGRRVCWAGRGMEDRAGGAEGWMDARPPRRKQPPCAR
jgi:hypothetical protein